MITNKLHISGIDKQLVGEVAAKIKKLRKADPYKGKGLRLAGEKVHRKAERLVEVMAIGVKVRKGQH